MEHEVNNLGIEKDYSSGVHWFCLALAALKQDHKRVDGRVECHAGTCSLKLRERLYDKQRFT